MILEKADKLTIKRSVDDVVIVIAEHDADRSWGVVRWNDGICTLAQLMREQFQCEVMVWLGNRQSPRAIVFQHEIEATA